MVSQIFHSIEDAFLLSCDKHCAMKNILIEQILITENYKIFYFITLQNTILFLIENDKKATECYLTLFVNAI